MTRNLLAAPLKIICSGTLLENHALTLTKIYQKYKQTALLLMTFTFYKSNLQ